MRCPDCNKFVSMELGDSPELSIDVDAEGVINGDVTITRNCADCGTELKEGRFDINVTIPEIIAHVQMHNDAQAAKDKARAEAEKAAAEAGTELPDESDEGEDPELTIENEEAEATEGGTRSKAKYGYRATFTVTCSCGDFAHEVETSDEMTSSEMEELS